MSIIGFFHGGGARRKSDEQWDKLVEALSNTQRDLAAANGQIATLTQQRDEARRNDIRHHHLWRCADREVKRLRFLLGEDAGVPVTHVPAPVDNGCRDRPLTVAETVRDTSLDAMALPGEEEMAAFLEGERAKNAAKATADTVTLPAVPDRSPVPDPDTAEIEARLNIPGPNPLASATTVPITSALKAVSKVHATVTSEAS